MHARIYGVCRSIYRHTPFRCLYVTLAEREGMQIPHHDCGAVLDVWKISEHLTILRCAVCSKVGRWEDQIYPTGRREFSKAILDQMK